MHLEDQEFMALTPQLQQKHSQSLVMTPKLAQSIKLLQLGHADLLSFILDEVQKNPLLEIDQDGKDQNRRDEASSSGNERDSKTSEQDSGDLNEVVSGEMTIKAGEQVADMDTNFENVYDGGLAGAEKVGSPSSDHSSSSGNSSSGSQNEDGLDAIAQLGATSTLAQHLEFQIALAFKEDADQKIAYYIAHALDDDGYFREDITETVTRLNTDLKTFSRVLAQFQTLEPVGVGARNLAECLALQLRERDRLDPAMATLIKNLNLIAKREFEALRKLCGVSADDFAGMIQEIKSLDPRPASQYIPILSETIIPDVIIMQKEDGNWSIDLNPETLPRVIVDHEYHAELEKNIDSEDGKIFITECLSNASWLTRSLDQRAQTILKVATEIVRQQDMFFLKGVEHLRPLNLKTVADAIKMHESTISRVTSNKYLMCEQGTFELKYFFSAAIGAKDGEESHAAATVKHRIKQLIDSEEPKKILSDDKIVSILEKSGIEIARRTVAKYREAMRIPSSVQRRRDKSAHIKKTG